MPCRDEWRVRLNPGAACGENAFVRRLGLFFLFPLFVEMTQKFLEFDFLIGSEDRASAFAGLLAELLPLRVDRSVEDAYLGMGLVNDFSDLFQLIRSELEIPGQLVDELIGAVRNAIGGGVNGPNVGGQSAHEGTQEKDHDNQHSRFTPRLSVFHDSIPPSSIGFRRAFEEAFRHPKPGHAVRPRASRPSLPAPECEKRRRRRAGRQQRARQWLRSATPRKRTAAR